MYLRPCVKVHQPFFIALTEHNALSLVEVNVILVDIRGYDTMGEITVLTLAALGGYAVIRSPQVNALRQRRAASTSSPRSSRQTVGSNNRYT